MIFEVNRWYAFFFFCEGFGKIFKQLFWDVIRPDYHILQLNGWQQGKAAMFEDWNLDSNEILAEENAQIDNTVELQFKLINKETRCL